MTPSLFLANIQLLDNKIQYLQLQLHMQCKLWDCCGFVWTETWLLTNITDSVIQLFKLTLFFFLHTENQKSGLPMRHWWKWWENIRNWTPKTSSSAGASPPPIGLHSSRQPYLRLWMQIGVNTAQTKEPHSMFFGCQCFKRHGKSYSLTCVVWFADIRKVQLQTLWAREIRFCYSIYFQFTTVYGIKKAKLDVWNGFCGNKYSREHNSTT